MKLQSFGNDLDVVLVRTHEAWSRAFEHMTEQRVDTFRGFRIVTHDWMPDDIAVVSTLAQTVIIDLREKT